MMPEAGHVTPTLPIARFLRNGGHQVCYLTVSPFSDFFQQHGFECECVTMPMLAPAAPDVHNLWVTRSTGAAIARELAARITDAGGTLPELIAEQLERTRPDLVVCDRAIARPFGDAIARRIQRPVIALSVTLPEDNRVHLPEVVLCPVEFEMPQEFPPARNYCEPSVWRDRAMTDLSWAQLDTRRRLVYCSFGTQIANYAGAATVLRAVISAFADLPAHQLLLAGGLLHEQLAAEERPDNVWLVQSAPQLDVLTRADVIITHGGLGTLKEAIMARVPPLVIPFAFDQPANGRRVEYHGIGRACPPSACTSAWIRRAVLDVAGDEAVRARLAALSAVFWARESECRAGRLLERAAIAAVA
jgi:UDP:flavonoid glycosyltransferase YjiC (YdhE family)